jgi:hypothetical protein
MANWISLKKLLEKCEIPEFELIDYIKEGLTPYSLYNLQPISFPIEQHEYSKKFNRLEEIHKERTALENFIALGKEVQVAKAKIIYTNKYNWKALRVVNKICDDLYMYSIYSGNLEPQSENGYISISAGMLQKLKKVRQKYVNERERVEAEIHEIIKDEPNFRDKRDTLESNKWKYFVKPESGEEIKKFISELKEKGAIFKGEDVEGTKKRFDLGGKKKTKVTSVEQVEKNDKKSRPNQEAKIEIQNAAKELWYEQKLKIGIKEMINRPEILDTEGKHYQPRTRRKWISEVAPKWAKKPGRRKGS